MSHRRRYSKRELLGSLQVDRIMSVSDLGLGPGANRWEVLRAFLKRGEARAERLIEDRHGFLILQSIPGRPNTGAIYLYRENLQAFFWLSFGNREDDLNGEDFQNALRVHRLIRLVGDGPRRVIGIATGGVIQRTPMASPVLVAAIWRSSPQVTLEW
jgi:hypothetical protein